MAISNHERVGKALELLKNGLQPFVERELKEQHKQLWFEEFKASLTSRQLSFAGTEDQPRWDVATVLKVMWDQWHKVFRKVLGQSDRSIISELRDVRNRWAHQNPFSSDDAYRAFAVGTALTGGPPHRSQRALLTHWAPTSGHDAQSLFGIRVQCSMLDDFHQPSVVDGIEESTDVRVEYPVHFLVNRAPLSRQATCRIRSSAFRRSGDRT